MNGQHNRGNLAKSRLCDICEINSAKELCCDCNQYFCETCKLHHLKISCLRGHHFKPYTAPEDEHVDPPSYDDVLSWGAQGGARAIPSVPQAKHFVGTYDFQDDEERYDYICTECRKLLTDKDIREHFKHTVLQVTGERSHKCLPVLVFLLQDSSIHSQKTTIDVLRRLLERRSAALDHSISNEEILLIANIMLIRVILPALQSEQELRRTIFVNAVGIIRSLSEIGKQEIHEGVIQHLREEKDLVNSLIKTVKIFVTKQDDFDGQGLANCMGALCNLSEDIVDEKENEENLQVKSPGAVSFMSKMFSSKKKTKPKNEVVKPAYIPRNISEYEGIWSESSMDLFAKVLTDASNIDILQSTMIILINLIPFVWHGGRNICTWLRKKKVLPCIVDFILTDGIARNACHLMLCLISDDTNKYLYGKYALKQLISLLPSDENTRTVDDVVSTVLSILIEISSGKDSKYVYESLMSYGGIEKLKNIKFRPQEKNESAIEEKEKASELLSILWKSESPAVRHGLSKQDVKADYVLY